MARISVPKGRKVTIYKNGVSVVDVDLILAEELQISLSSTFGPPTGMEGLGSDLLTDLGSIFDSFSGGRINFTGQNKYFTFQAWRSTGPVELNLNFEFHVGLSGKYSAKEAVYDPIMALAKLPLPTEKGESGMLEAPGVTVGDMLASAISGWFANDDVQEEKFKINVMSIEIGNIIRLPSIVVRKAEPIFSSEVTASGYPIAGKIQLGIASTTTATTGLLELSQEQFDEAIGSSLSGTANRPVPEEAEEAVPEGE